jgi:hypothetical protein
MTTMILPSIVAGGLVVVWAVSSFLSILRDPPVQSKDIEPGDILLQRPVHQLHWCVEHGIWPGWSCLFQSMFVVLVWPLLQSHSAHALQVTERLESNGDLVVIHTQYGRVRKMTTAQLPYGYIQTCVLVKTRDRWNAISGGGHRVRHVLEGLITGRVNPVVFLMTPLIRKTKWFSAIYPLHDKRFRVHNCTHLIALAWLECGVRLVDLDRIPIQGIYPDDFRVEAEVRERIKEGEEEEKKARPQPIRYRGGEIHPDNVAGIVGDEGNVHQE